MLLMISLDSENADWLREQMDNGNLPNLAALARNGVTREVNTPMLAGVPYTTMYTGLRPADHGFHFPMQWNPKEQRVEPWYTIRLPETVFERMDRAGKRAMVIDVPECPPQKLKNGFAISGVQFRARVLLHEWNTDAARAGRLLARMGRATRADEVFGEVSTTDLHYLRRALLPAPDRLMRAAIDLLRQEPDCLWVNCCGLHMAAHQFLRLPSVREESERRLLEGTRLELARGYDGMVGALLAALPPASRVFVTYAKGMGRVTEWSDLLPAMLRRILGQKDGNQPVTRLRQLLPRSLRRWVAASMSDDRAMRMMANLSTPHAEWKHTRAFCLPTDYPGFIRFNLAGRERAGIVRDREAEGLRQEIAEGLRTFVDTHGEPCVDTVFTSEGLLGPGRRLSWFPDLIIRWRRPAEGAVHHDAARSQKFGEVRRVGQVVGRAGQHTPGAFTILHGPGADRTAPSERVHPEDIPATLLGGIGVGTEGLPGRSFW